MTGKGGCFHCMWMRLSHDRVARGQKQKNCCASLLCNFLLKLQCCRNQFPSYSFVDFVRCLVLLSCSRNICDKLLFCEFNISTGWLLFRGVCQITSNRKSEAIKGTYLLLCSSTARLFLPAFVQLWRLPFLERTYIDLSVFTFYRQFACLHVTKFTCQSRSNTTGIRFSYYASNRKNFTKLAGKEKSSLCWFISVVLST